MIYKSILIIFFAFAMIACQRQAPAPVAVPIKTASAPTKPVAVQEAAVETTMAQAGVQPTQAGLDSKAFAGTFTGTLPCADCPGIQETLVLDANGHFELTDIYRERPTGTYTLQGTWSSEAKNKRIRLDPGSKSERDRLYALDGNDRLIQMDVEGRPIHSALHYALSRRR